MSLGTLRDQLLYPNQQVPLGLDPGDGSHMSSSLNSVKGLYWGSTIEVIKGDTRNLDESSFKDFYRATMGS